MRTMIVTALWIACLTGATAWAQQGPANPPPPPAGEELQPAAEPGNRPAEWPPERRRMSGMRRGPVREGDEQGPQPLDRWMNRMSERNPEEMERLRQLRAEDPEAFHEALRQRIAQGREGDSPETFHRRRPDGASASPEMRAAVTALRDAVRAFHQSADEDEKWARRGEARNALRQLFELSDAQRGRDIERMENALAQLKAQLEDHLERRDAMIDEKLDRLLSHPENMPGLHRRGPRESDAQPEQTP